ncbi:aminopeptidase P family protein [Mycoplasmatota bacterium WC30]
MKNTDFVKRRDAFCKDIKTESFALLAAGEAPYKGKDQLYPFFVNRNFFYLTGLEREKFILLLLKNGNTHFEYLFIEESSDFATKWIGSKMSKEEASEISGIELNNILYLSDFDSFIANRVLLDSRQTLSTVPKRMYLDLFREYLMVKPNSLNIFKKIIDTYPELKIKDLTTVLDEMRRVKSDAEVKEIQIAIDYTNEGIKSMMKKVQPNMNERELDALFTYSIKLAGSSGNSFNTITASGKNATVLHYEENDSIMEDNSLVLNDLGALSNQYAADITRTFPVNGKFTKRQAEIYELVLSVNKKIISLVKPGICLSELNKISYNLLAEGMIKLGKITEKSELTKYYYHNIGHYLGLDVHDVGSYTKELEPGVVITVEPGIYVEEEGIGIRIEDDILVTKDGYVNLSKKIIKEIVDIEEFMKK